MSMSQPYTSYAADSFGASGGALKVSANPWQDFFGEPRFTGNQSPYDVESRDTWTLPEAYKGRSKKLSDEVEFMVYSDQNFYTGVVMPVDIVADANYVTWNQTIYGTQMPTLVPELGSSRIMSSTKIAGSASFDRRGLSFYFEHGFMHTIEGRQHYVNTLKQLALNVLEFAKFDVINTLLTSQNVNFEWERKNGVYKGKRIADLMQKQIWTWACLQKYTNGLNLLDVEISSAMERYKGEADTWIVPPKVQNYLQVVPPERIVYSIAGPAGPQRLVDGPNALASIGTSRVYVARTYDIDREGPRDLLSADAEIGEYVEMRDRDRDTNYEHYSSKCRHVKIYNEDGDAWFEARLAWALDESRRFDPKTGVPLGQGGHDALLGAFGAAGEADVFAYYDDDTQQTVPARYFGQIRQDFLTARDRLNFGRTVLAALRDCDPTCDFVKDWNAGAALVNRIEQLGANAATAAELDAANTAVLGGEAVDKLVPGLQSYAGIKSIAASRLPEKDVAERFLKAVDTLVAKLSAVLPNSIALNEKFASPWWVGPLKTREATFFENVVARSRVPLWISGAGRGVGSSPDGTLLEAALAEQLAMVAARAPAAVDEITNGVAPDAASMLRKIRAAALIGRVVLIGKDGVDGLEPALAKMRQLVGVTAAGALNFANAFNADEFTAAMLAVPGAFRAPQRTLAAINQIFNEQLAAPAGERAGTAPLKRTVLLASPVVVRDLAKAAAANPAALIAVPSLPHSPESPMSVAALRSFGAKLADADDAYLAQDEDTPASDAVPAFDGFIGTELSPHLEHTALLRNVAGAGGGAAAAIGSEYGGGDGDEMSIGDEYGGRVSSRPAQRRARSRDAAETVDELRTAPMRASWLAIQRMAGGQSILAAIAHAFDLTPINKRAFLRFIEHNVLFPVSFLLLRPHAIYAMLTMIKCLKGSRMGNYLQQRGLFEVGDDVDVQAHIASYTYKSKAVVREPKFVWVARNVFANGYRGGMGVRTFDPRTYNAGSGEYGQASLFVLVTPFTETAGGRPISITGDTRINEQDYQLQKRGQLDYTGVAWANSVWGWRAAQQVGENGGFGAIESVSERSGFNTICCQGQALYYSTVTRDFTVLQRGTGHWGDAVYVGCAKVRRGEFASFDPAKYAYTGFSEA